MLSRRHSLHLLLATGLMTGNAARAQENREIAIAAPGTLSKAMVRAEDFGARGDGVTRNTAALQRRRVSGIARPCKSWAVAQ